MTHSMIEQALAAENRRSGVRSFGSRNEAIAAETPVWEI